MLISMFYCTVRYENISDHTKSSSKLYAREYGEHLIHQARARAGPGNTQQGGRDNLLHSTALKPEAIHLPSVTPEAVPTTVAKSTQGIIAKLTRKK